MIAASIPGHGDRRVRQAPTTSSERLATDAIARRDYRTAIDTLQRDLARRGPDAGSLTMIAQCYEWLGEYEEAIRYADRVLEGMPASPVALKLITRCYRERGDLGRAYACLCRALATPLARPVTAPRWIARLLRALSFLPWARRRRLRMRRELRAALRRERDWRRWAQQRKDWYERFHGTGSDVLH